MIIEDAVHDPIVLSGRPIVLCDVDEVALEFLDPFSAFLRAQGLELVPRSFRLTGYIERMETREPVSAEVVADLTEAFFAAQDAWQVMATGAATALENLTAIADVIYLTAMPPRHHGIRRALLNRFGLGHPMIATEEAKGPIAARFFAASGGRLAFIDDIFVNLHSVRHHAPGTLLVNLMANETFRALAPHPGDDVAQASSWPQAERLIRDHFEDV